VLGLLASSCMHGGGDKRGSGFGCARFFKGLSNQQVVINYNDVLNAGNERRVESRNERIRRNHVKLVVGFN